MHCPGSQDHLAMDEVLYYGFGGYTVYRNNKVFYEGEPDAEWEKYKTLKDIEKSAKKEPTARWKVVLNNPLRGATWRRNKEGHWVLKETNMGFA